VKEKLSVLKSELVIGAVWDRAEVCFGASGFEGEFDCVEPTPEREFIQLDSLEEAGGVLE